MGKVLTLLENLGSLFPSLTNGIVNRLCEHLQFLELVPALYSYSALNSVAFSLHVCFRLSEIYLLGISCVQGPLLGMMNCGISN